IDYERGRLDIVEQIAGREEETFFHSVITVRELLHGRYRRRWSCSVLGKFERKPDDPCADDEATISLVRALRLRTNLIRTADFRTGCRGSFEAVSGMLIGP
ncbi:MAG: hypothetical protein ACRELT_01015, partial [Longimicrobiales bacterium]